MKLTFDYSVDIIVKAEVGSAHVGDLVVRENKCRCLCCCMGTGGR